MVGYDIDSRKIALLEQGVSPLVDEYIEKFIKEKRSNVRYTSDFEQAVYMESIGDCNANRL